MAAPLLWLFGFGTETYLSYGNNTQGHLPGYWPSSPHLLVTMLVELLPRMSKFQSFLQTMQMIA